MKKCLSCGSIDVVDVAFVGVALAKSDGIVDAFTSVPIKGVACTVCGNVQVFADVEKLKQWAHKG